MKQQPESKNKLDHDLEVEGERFAGKESKMGIM